VAGVNRPNPASPFCRARSEKREPKARPTRPPIRTAAAFSKVPVTATSALFGHRRGDPRAAGRHPGQKGGGGRGGKKEEEGGGGVQGARGLAFFAVALVDQPRHPALGAADDGASQVEGAS